MAPPAPSRLRVRLRRAVAGVLVAAAAAAVVVGLGLLAGAAAQSRSSEPPAAPVVAASTVTVDQQGTVWEVARDVAPVASGAELSAVVERIVSDNALTSVLVHPGQVLRVTAG